MAEYKYQWNGYEHSPVIVRRNILGIKAEKYNPKTKEWEYSYKAGEYFLGIDNSYFNIDGNEIIKIINS